MMYRAMRWLAFQANATRIDVLHSPFVFKLYQNALKRNKQFASSSFSTGYRITPQQQRLCTNVFSYMNYSTVIDLRNTANLAPIDLVMADAATDDSTHFDAYDLALSERLSMAVLNIHESPKATAFYEMLMRKPFAHVCVDVFDVAFLFYRPEQVPQRFCLRI
jgi:hypothetical protein